MNLLDYLPIVPDFPQAGISFRDISPLLANPTAFTYAIEKMHTLSKQMEFTHILGIESRGFIFASALAMLANKGIILARKPNKLPQAVYSQSYGLEYGTDTLEMQKNILPKDAQVLLIDDVLATGGTMIAAGNLVKQANCQIAGALALLELKNLNGQHRLQSEGIHSHCILSI